MKRVICLLLILTTICCLDAMHTNARADQPSYEYQSLGDGIYRYGSTGYLVESVHDHVNEENLQNLRNMAGDLNRLVPLGGKIKKYVYFVESSWSTDLNADMHGENELYCLIRELFEADGIGTLALESPDDYMNWFYQTDNHWNYKGSYQGYLGIVHMIFGADEPVIQPAETKVFKDIIFNGSYSRLINQPLSTEPFTVYRFNDLPKYKAKTSRKAIRYYGHASTYFKGKYSRRKLFNHYAYFYGGDYGTVTIATHQNKKPNLLVFSNSFDNAILLLLSNHFNNIYSVDLRHYEEDLKKSFHIEQYIQKNQIDTILVVGDWFLFYNYFPIE